MLWAAAENWCRDWAKVSSPPQTSMLTLTAGGQQSSQLNCGWKLPEKLLEKPPTSSDSTCVKLKPCGTNLALVKHCICPKGSTLKVKYNFFIFSVFFSTAGQLCSLKQWIYFDLWFWCGTSNTESTLIICNWTFSESFHFAPDLIDCDKMYL